MRGLVNVFILVAISVAAFPTWANSTSNEVKSPEQKQAHKKVVNTKKRLSKELKENASPETLTKTTTQIQVDQAEANKADVEEHANKAIQNKIEE